MALESARAEDVVRDLARVRARALEGGTSSARGMRALLHDAAAMTERGGRDRASQTERGRLVDASTACADESFGREEEEGDSEAFERRLARALRACEDALAAANGSDVADPFAMLARGAEREFNESPSSRETDFTDSIESRTSVRGAV